MIFDSGKITVDDILLAVKKIEDENLSLNPSTGYDVIINGKPYPPKEIIRISYKIATGHDSGVIYGGEQVNKPLRELGFEIIQKVGIWKLGCNWGSGAPSFYNYIKEKKIVISYEAKEYNEGDLILITEGFTVYAIAKVLTNLTPLIGKGDYLELFSDYKVEYGKQVLYAEAEWYELPKTDIFLYELQQGIVRVRHQEIRDRVINIWENRFVKFDQLNFYLKENKKSLITKNYPCLVLIPTTWDDYGYRTSYILVFHKSESERVEIGVVKILHIEDLHTKLPKTFYSLSQNFCSLGQTLEFYKRIKIELPTQYKDILRALNDCALFKDNYSRFNKNEGFELSLLRASEAEMALNEAESIIEGDVESRTFQFKFKFQITGAVEPHIVDFSFDTDKNLPNRFFCLVGKNGTGKTKIISQLANKLSDDKELGLFEPKRPVFSKVIAASFSYFDKFRFPDRKDISYNFIGVKSEGGLLSEDELAEIVWDSYKRVAEDKSKKDFLLQCISTSLETEYLNFNINELGALSTKKDFFERTEDIFSSGQKIVFQFIIRFLAEIKENSLLLFDEPETHLHPNIAGRLLRTINKILTEYKSYCILSTHSPIILQEIPSRFIRIFDRHENVPIIYEPVIECLGENLSIISNSIFRANEEKELYRTTLEGLVKNNPLEIIEEMFNNKLSLNAQLFIQSINNSNND